MVDSIFKTVLMVLSTAGTSLMIIGATSVTTIGLGLMISGVLMNS